MGERMTSNRPSSFYHSSLPFEAPNFMLKHSIIQTKSPPKKKILPPAKRRARTGLWGCSSLSKESWASKLWNETCFHKTIFGAPNVWRENTPMDANGSLVFFFGPVLWIPGKSPQFLGISYYPRYPEKNPQNHRAPNHQVRTISWPTEPPPQAPQSTTAPPPATRNDSQCLGRWSFPVLPPPDWSIPGRIWDGRWYPGNPPRFPPCVKKVAFRVSRHYLVGIKIIIQKEAPFFIMVATTSRKYHSHQQNPKIPFHKILDSWPIASMGRDCRKGFIILVTN